MSKKVTWLSLDDAFEMVYCGFRKLNPVSRCRFKKKVEAQELPLDFTKVDNTIQISAESIEQYKLKNSSLQVA